MNLFFKFFKALTATTLLFLMSQSNSFAINLKGIYLSQCQREMGIIIDQDVLFIRVLTIQGYIKKIPVYDIIYMVDYPLDIVPIEKVNLPKTEKIFRIKSLQQNSIVDLVTGWPIDYTLINISFLTVEGQEVVISRDNIWQIEILNASPKLAFQKKIIYKYLFVHPYPFRHCDKEISGNLLSKENTRTIYPQELFHNHIIIKKELTRLKNGKDKITQYNREQQFYPVPQVFKNFTTLGYWFSLGSRYGGSLSRSNNLAPILVDQYSSGPFGYQHLFLTGSAPMPYSIHEEPQTQVYYRFKADYFHMAFMLDPNLFLLGEKYYWKEKDFPNNDDRMNEMLNFEIGFDYGFFTLQFLVGAISLGIKYQDQVHLSSSGLSRFGLTFHNHLVKLDIQIYNPFDPGNKQEGKLDFFRLNFEIFFLDKIRPMYSFIWRKLVREDSFTSFYYKSQSFTNALYIIYQLTARIQSGVFISLEYHKNRYFYPVSTLNNSHRWYPKGGIHISLSF